MQKLIRPLFSLYRNAITDINEQKKTITHYISGSEANDYGQVINPAGYDDSRYRKNPIVLFQHGLSDMFVTSPANVQLDFVLGRITYIRAEGEYLKAETEFRDDEKSGFASDVYNLYKNGFLSGWSKWFYPISEPRHEVENVYYDKWGIYEYSAVFIPVDGDAVTKETNYLNALEVLKSDSMKKYFMHSLMSQKMNTDDSSLTLADEISSIKKELNELKHSSKTDFETRLRNETEESIQKYHKIIMPAMEQFSHGIKKLNDLSIEIEALVKRSVLETVNNITGKIN